MEYDQILEGDCLEWLKQIPDASVHMAITSSPYNVGARYQSYHDRPEEPAHALFYGFTYLADACG